MRTCSFCGTITDRETCDNCGERIQSNVESPPDPDCDPRNEPECNPDDERYER